MTGVVVATEVVTERKVISVEPKEVTLVATWVQEGIKKSTLGLIPLRNGTNCPSKNNSRSDIVGNKKKKCQASAVLGSTDRTTAPSSSFLDDNNNGSRNTTPSNNVNN